MKNCGISRWDDPREINAKLKALNLYNTIDKTSRLKMKSFSTVRDTQRGSQSYMEKKRVKDEIRWNQKRREQANQ